MVLLQSEATTTQDNITTQKGPVFDFDDYYKVEVPKSKLCVEKEIQIHYQTESYKLIVLVDNLESCRADAE